MRRYICALCNCQEYLIPNLSERRSSSLNIKPDSIPALSNQSVLKRKYVLNLKSTEIISFSIVKTFHQTFFQNVIKSLVVKVGHGASFLLNENLIANQF